MTTRRPVALALLTLLAAACSGGSTAGTGPPSSQPAITAPAPGVTLPPGTGSGLVPTPTEVPAGMILLVKGSGPRDLATVAGYSASGTGAQHDASVAAAAAKLRSHRFEAAYVAQYANQATGAFVSVVASSFATPAGATADLADDQRSTSGKAVTVQPVGDASSARITPVPGKVPGELLLLRFRKGATTWSLAFQAAPKADPAVAVALARLLVARAP